MQCIKVSVRLICDTSCDIFCTFLWYFCDKCVIKVWTLNGLVPERYCAEAFKHLPCQISEWAWFRVWPDRCSGVDDRSHRLLVSSHQFPEQSLFVRYFLWLQALLASNWQNTKCQLAKINLIVIFDISWIILRGTHPSSQFLVKLKTGDYNRLNVEKHPAGTFLFVFGDNTSHYSPQ